MESSEKSDPMESSEKETSIVERQDDIEAQIRKLEIEVASRRNYEKVVVVLGAAVVSAAALVTWIGFESFSDIENDVRKQVIQSLTDVDTDTVVTLGRFKDYDRRMSKLLESLKAAEGRWRDSIEPALAELSGDIPDLKGRFLSLLDGGPIEDKSQDPVWRRRATAVVLNIVEHLEETQRENEVSQFAPDDVFNVAQLSRHLSRYDLERRLVVAAHEAKPDSAAARALFLQSEARKSGSSDESAFTELMGLVTDLTIENPHIVLAEAWNAAEDLRRYSHLIAALDSLIARAEANSGAFLPSYAYALKGAAHLRRGLVGEIDLVVTWLVDAVDRLKLEGTHSQWAAGTIQQISVMRKELVNSRANIESLMRLWTIVEYGRYRCNCY